MKTQLNKILSVVPLLLLIFSFTASASQEISVANTPEKKVSEFFKNSNYTFENTTDTNFQKSEADYSASNTTAFGFEHAFGKTTAGLQLEANKDLVGLREFVINDSLLYATRELFQLHDRIVFSGSTSLLIPTSEESRNVLGLRAGVTITPSVKINFGGIGLKYVSLKLSTGFTKYFYNFKQNAEGKYNTNYKTKYSAAMNYAPKDWFSIAYSFVVQEREKYNKIVNNSQYSNELMISSALTKQFSISLGITDEGAIYKENGIDNNVKIFDNDTGSAYFTMSYSL